VPDVAIDNDVLIKTSVYGLINDLVHGVHGESIGVLGAARFVVVRRIARMELAGDRAAAQEVFLKFMDGASVLEPVADELHVATQIETTAQRRGLALDAGESQLAAIVINRAIQLLETGDKRAIRAFEALIDELEALATLAGKLRCLEQLMLRCADEGDPSVLAQAICSEPQVDRSLSICFRCFSPPPQGPALDRTGLESYIEALRADAPRVLEP
jgi:hypothetical protein